MTVNRNDIVRVMQIIHEISDWTIIHVPPPDVNEVKYWILQYIVERRVRRQIKVYVGLSQNCLCFQLPMIIYVLPESVAAVRYYLLMLNSHIKIAKFGMDAKEEIYLYAEMLIDTAALQSVQAYLECLRTYFESFYREIDLIATNRRLAELWLSVARKPRAEELIVELGQTTDL
jgi:hypothetical protein